ncbi:tyrosine-type recombinase/integrase [Terasakiella pusilla]|uniref:tyrosine-type recombinase/integrase n=1 Tax=Terasakiella pusilla TaxID=64973 RepID=UPI003AA86DBA
MDANAQVGDVIALEDRIAKKMSGRTVPLNRDLRSALVALADQCKPLPNDFVIQSERRGPMSANTVAHWFHRQYSKLGYIGCSSHSGRRTFITRAAQRVGQSVVAFVMFSNWRGIVHYR